VGIALCTAACLHDRADRKLLYNGTGRTMALACLEGTPMDPPVDIAACNTKCNVVKKKNEGKNDASPINIINIY